MTTIAGIYTVINADTNPALCVCNKCGAEVLVPKSYLREPPKTRCPKCVRVSKQPEYKRSRYKIEYSNNPERFAESKARWKEKNPDKYTECNARISLRRRLRKKEDESLRLADLATQNNRYYDRLDKDWEKIKLVRLRGSAKKRGIDFSISTGDLTWVDVCPILKIPLIKVEKKGQTNSKNLATVDRIDNSKGYVPGNVQVISRKANMMKNDASPEDLLNFAEWVNKNVR